MCVKRRYTTGAVPPANQRNCALPSLSRKSVMRIDRILVNENLLIETAFVEPSAARLLGPVAKLTIDRNPFLDEWIK